MDPLLKAAPAGVLEDTPERAATATLFDSLSRAIPSDDKERRLLLEAGARVIYYQSGYIPQTIDAQEAPPAEDMPPCSSEATEVLRHILADAETELQVLALERLQEANLRLTPELLPATLDMRDENIRRLLRPLIGKRGVWLSQFNPAWAWVGELTGAPDGWSLADAETLWREGTAARRLEALRWVRAADARLACQWVEAAWKGEKADQRVELVRVLQVNLGPEDEPLLEGALDDRAGSVRSAAAETLLRLPNSALVGRMVERADTMLGYTKGALSISLPATLDAAWQRDGIAAQTAGRKGDGAWWLGQVLANVPPSHWEARFDISPEALVALAASTKLGHPILEGWTRAAAGFGEESWLIVLAAFWSQPIKRRDLQQRAGDMYTLLAPHIPQSLQEETVMRLLGDVTSASSGPSFYEAISQVNHPWSEALGDEYLRGLRAFVAGLDQKSKNAEPWDDTLSIASAALPPRCVMAACEPLAVPKDIHNWYIQHFQRQLDDFASTMQLRTRIDKEIPL
jgi:Family of unknown function (DUF5691)